MLLSHQYAYDALQHARRELDQLTESNFAAATIESLKTARLTSLLERAALTPAYQDIVASGEAVSSGLDAIPVTSKATLKQSPELFQTDFETIKYYETSGTSGQPTPTPRTARDIVWNVVSIASAWRELLPSNSRAVILLPSDISPIGDTISYVCEYLGVRVARCYPFAYGIVDWARIYALFKRYQPDVIFTSPGVLLQFMRVAKQRNYFDEIRTYVERILLLGEVCTSALQQMVASKWNAAVFNASYGSTETGTIAAAAADGQLHLLTHSFILELYQDGQLTPLAPGKSGELVVTPLNNYARPLLRYNTGDVVSVEQSTATSGIATQPILNIAGRQSDALIIHERPLQIMDVEQVVYQSGHFTGYFIEMTSNGDYARLLLEKDVGLEMDSAGLERELADAFRQHDIHWDAIVLLNQLPVTTKSGGSQKNWKKTHVKEIQMTQS